MRRTAWPILFPFGVVLLCGLLGPTPGLVQVPDDFDRNTRRAVPRDSFPVLSNPRLTPAARAALRDDEWVIGIALKKEAKAYPISVMGIHELGNDTCGGEPIAVSW